MEIRPDIDLLRSLGCCANPYQQADRSAIYSQVLQGWPVPTLSPLMMLNAWVPPISPPAPHWLNPVPDDVQ